MIAYVHERHMTSCHSSSARARRGGRAFTLSSPKSRGCDMTEHQRTCIYQLTVCVACVLYVWVGSPRRPPFVQLCVRVLL